MFSSLAKYIFGGLTGNSPNEPVECETREVNDWLLVNLPDQAEKDVDIDIDYEEEDEKEEEIDNTEHHHVHSEEDEESSEKDEEIDNTEHHHVHSEKDEESSDKDEESSNRDEESSEKDEESCEEDEECSQEDEESSEEDEECSQEDEESSEEDQGSGEEDDEYQEMVSAQRKQSICDYDKSYCELQIPYEVKLSFDLQRIDQLTKEVLHSIQKIDSLGMKDLLYESKLTSVRILFNLRVIMEQNQLTVNVRTPKRIPDLASHTKNHASQPAVSPKAELLERIKDLKPAQRAIEYEKKKYISRSQLNRQNRNYIFQASSKTNRRKNLQRHHSGANNNRRC